MEWVLYALLGAQFVLILLALRCVNCLGEIAEAINAPRMDLDRMMQKQTATTGLLLKELRKIDDRIANGGQARWNELERIRKLLEEQARYK